MTDGLWMHNDTDRERSVRNGAELLREFAAGRDCACPRCGYNLRDIEGDLCPECGDALVLRIGLARPRLAWFITGVVGLSMGLGFHSAMSMVVVILLITGQWLSSDSDQAIWFFAWAVAFGGLLVAWVAFRRRLGRRLGRRGPLCRWSLALLSFVPAILLPIGFYLIAN